jgi:outer membrane autotransporter protein
MANTNLRARLFLSCAVATLSIAAPLRAAADDFTINTPVVTTNGGFVVDGNDTITIIDSGSITPPAGDAGLRATGTNNVLDNQGGITTTGDNTFGINARDDNTITNSGSISTMGDGATGIRAGNGNAITNSGRVISAQAESFFLGGDNTLNLLAPSFIGGEINLGDNTTVNITSGPSHSILWDLSTGTMSGGMPNLSGPVPIFYNAATQQVATFDPTRFAGSANALADLTGNVSGLVRRRLTGPASSSATSSHALQAPVSTEQNANARQRMDYAFDGSSASAGTGMWISAFGSTSEYDGGDGALDQNFDHVGLAIGYDTDISADLTLGGLVGYGWGTFGADSRFVESFDSDAEGLFAAIYGQKRMGGDFNGFIDFSLTAGALSHSDQRFVNDNLAPLGVSYAAASYNSWLIAPELRVGADLGEGEWTYTPSAQLRYGLQSIDGYTETGLSAANAQVGGRNIGVLEARAELAASRQLDFGSFTTRVGYQHREATGDGNVSVTMIGQTQQVGYDANTGGGLYLGADASINLPGNMSLDLSTEAVLGDAQTVRGTASLTSSF